MGVTLLANDTTTSASSPIIGRDAALCDTLARARAVAATHAPVLITGETGTGKELLARLIHDAGPRAARPFVAVNCGTLSRDLADSALFGHERGAFTGAASRKVGWFEEADRGTLVLDEIGELPLELQAKLLRVLETGRLRRVGGTGDVSVDVRLIAVTWRELRREIDRGGFRADLFHRLSAFELRLPPLRARRADIPMLVDRFLAELSPLRPRSLETAALERLMAHSWPGNIRELRNVLTRAVILGRERIEPAALELPPAQTEPGWGEEAAAPPPVPRLAEPSFPPAAPGASPLPTEAMPVPLAVHRPEGGPVESVAISGRTLAEIERSVFEWALRRNGGSRRRAARALAVPRSTFCDRAKRYGLA
jgi:two-component system nitrogen regulation response regulator GlnG